MVSNLTYQDEWSPILLPWISYKTNSYSISPMALLLTGDIDAMHWQAGLGLDYHELFDDTSRGFLAKVDSQYHWGPLRFTVSTDSRLVDPLKSWQFDTTVGTQYPIGVGMLGAEVGFHLQSNDWINNEHNLDSDLENITEENNTAVQLAPTFAMQYTIDFNQWQSMFMLQHQGAIKEFNLEAQQTYTLLLTSSW
ncbi:MAG: hypothetical protein HRU38_10595 [Saccharospirillaceae bacterium]|nr:hypothetical protein [Pseudomonadales bacterium]NRB79102.1 hypothetical protein [Saccharospirillaceae bacterium]